ncbi:nucleoside-diphosphate sugar epimerase [Paenibacillus sp. SC116]|uniref:nucleoside-diphosphate sugar epimerase n=1 Tax=Paenibacillus sp. SC116 TaxID=2968986 RepID=UPI00215A8A7D|nr:nucleoside-diphosphate sugar epimerase [Paenibacillus sp. SC116]MCR8846164.1 nucleoside-diphosphate sugar epimerase [Paenibacillus sp. SC116]
MKPEDKVNEIIVHMAHTHNQMAKILQAKRQVAVRMSQLVHAVPDELPQIEHVSEVKMQSGQVTRCLIDYMVSIAELEEAMADQLKLVLKDLHEPEEE